MVEHALPVGNERHQQSDQSAQIHGCVLGPLYGRRRQGGPPCRRLMERGLDRHRSSPFRQGRRRPPDDHDSPWKEPDHRSTNHLAFWCGNASTEFSAGRPACPNGALSARERFCARTVVSMPVITSGVGDTEVPRQKHPSLAAV